MLDSDEDPRYNTIHDHFNIHLNLRVSLVGPAMAMLVTHSLESHQGHEVYPRDPMALYEIYAN